MKKIIVLFLFVFLAFPAVYAQNNKQQRTVSFDGKTFYLQPPQSNAISDVNEYLLKGKTFNNYTEMVALWNYPLAKMPPAQYAKLVMDNVAKNKHLSFETIANKEETVAITFLAVAPQQFLEFNVFIFRLSKRGNIEALQFVAREYIPRGVLNDSPVSKLFIESFESKYTKNPKTRYSWYEKLEKVPFPVLFKKPVKKQTK